MSETNIARELATPPLMERQRRVLVVEDDPSIRALIVRILTRDGFSVAEATNGREALSVLNPTCSFEVIVLDLAMPHLNGLEVIDYLGQHLPDSLKRIVVVTANTRVLPAQLPAAICHVLVKPFDLDQFRAVVHA